MSVHDSSRPAVTVWEFADLVQQIPVDVLEAIRAKPELTIHERTRALVDAARAVRPDVDAARVPATDRQSAVDWIVMAMRFVGVGSR